MAFVGTKNINSLEELKEFLTDLKQDSNYYFLRSPHQVSGIKPDLPEDINSAKEGQIFNSQWELRWKRKGAKYELLLLSTVAPKPDWKFEPIGKNRKDIDWKTEDRNALLYEANEKISDREIRSKETRFPQGFSHNLTQIGQRYFLDSQTATVHFVALTVKA